MGKIIRDFISEDDRKYKFRLGRTIASSLTGFIGGALVASIIWYLAIYFR